MIPWNHVDWSAEPSENVGHLLHEHAIDTVVLESVPTNDYKFRTRASRRIDDPPCRAEPLLPHPRSRRARVRSAHADLPICGVKELHVLDPPTLGNDGASILLPPVPTYFPNHDIPDDHSGCGFL
jgi:hypothetical protein